MVIKVISVAVAICIFTVSLMSAQSATDPLFLFISNNPLMIFTRLIIVALLLGIAFKSRFKYRISQKVAGATGISLMIFGIIGGLSQNIISAFADYIKVFDFMFIQLAGIVFCLSALTYGYAQRRLPLQNILSRNLPKPVGLKLNTTQPKEKSV